MQRVQAELLENNTLRLDQQEKQLEKYQRETGDRFESFRECIRNNKEEILEHCEAIDALAENTLRMDKDIQDQGLDFDLTLHEIRKERDLFRDKLENMEVKYQTLLQEVENISWTLESMGRYSIKTRKQVNILRNKSRKLEEIKPKQRADNTNWRIQSAEPRNGTMTPGRASRDQNWRTNKNRDAATIN